MYKEPCCRNCAYYSKNMVVTGRELVPETGNCKNYGVDEKIRKTVPHYCGCDKWAKMRITKEQQIAEIQASFKEIILLMDYIEDVISYERE